MMLLREPHITSKPNAELARFWAGIESPEVVLLSDMYAWAAKFAKTVTPDVIIDAIIEDLRLKSSPYPGRASKRGSFERRGEYSAIVVSLDFKGAYKALYRWQRTGDERDKANATRLIKALRTHRFQ
jgi:hypothetical protein